MKKILAIAVVLSALGTGIVFADDNTCVQITQGIGCAVGGSLGGFQGCAVGTVIGTAVGNTVCPSSSSSGRQIATQDLNLNQDGTTSIIL